MPNWTAGDLARLEARRSAKNVAEVARVEATALRDNGPCTTKTLTITVPVTPVGKPRQTQRDRWAKRECVMRYRAYADQVCLCVRQQVGILPEAAQIARLDWVAYFVPPLSWNNKKRLAAYDELHRVRPDLDNICKGIFDILFPGGDSAIAHGEYKKLWAPLARLVITVEYTPKSGTA